MCDVSLVAPLAILRFPSYVPGSPWHHRSIVSAIPTSIGHGELLAGAKVIAFSAIDLLSDPQRLEVIGVEFSELRKEHSYPSFIVEDVIPEKDFYSVKGEKCRSMKLEDWSAYWNEAFGSMEI